MSERDFNPSESAQMHVMHCSIPSDRKKVLQNTLTDNLRLFSSAEKELTESDSGAEKEQGGKKVDVHVFCPREYKDEILALEEAEGCFWPVKKTIAYIREKMMGIEGQVLIASTPIVQEIERQNLFEETEVVPVVKELEGRVPSEQFYLLPSLLKEAIRDLREKYQFIWELDEDVFDRDIRYPLIGIYNTYLGKLEDNEKYKNIKSYKKAFCEYEIRSSKDKINVIKTCDYKKLFK